MDELIAMLKETAAVDSSELDLRVGSHRDRVARGVFAQQILKHLSKIKPIETQPQTRSVIPDGVTSVFIRKDDGDTFEVFVNSDGVIELNNEDSLIGNREDHKAIDTLCEVLQALKR